MPRHKSQTVSRRLREVFCEQVVLASELGIGAYGIETNSLTNGILQKHLGAWYMV